ncbi:hypothetical protein [Halorussus limi]|nr:hypothetical protein [Halorussus limi]
MSEDIDEDLQGLLRAIIVLVAVFGAFALLSSLFGATPAYELLS